MSEEDFDQRGALTEEFQALAQEQNTIAAQYQAVQENLNAGKIGFDVANHYKIELRNQSEANNARMAELYTGLQNIRADEIKALRQEVPGWETDEGFQKGAKELGESLEDFETFLAKATPAEIKQAEMGRRAKKKESDALNKLNKRDRELMSQDTGVEVPEGGVPTPMRAKTETKSTRRQADNDLLGAEFPDSWLKQ